MSQVPPPPAGPPAGLTPDERTWGGAAHWSALVGACVAMAFLGPLLVLLLKGSTSPYVRRQAVVIDEHAVAAQDVRDEVVGEDRQAVQVFEAGDTGEREVAGGDLGALVEPAIGVHRHPLDEGLGEPLGRE